MKSLSKMHLISLQKAFTLHATEGQSINATKKALKAAFPMLPDTAIKKAVAGAILLKARANHQARIAGLEQVPFGPVGGN